MPHGPRSRYAFASLTTLAALIVAVAAALTWSSRSHGAVDGVSFGDDEQHIVQCMGPSMERWDYGPVVTLVYDDAQYMLRNGKVYGVVLRGNTNALYDRAIAQYGQPIGTWGESVDWLSDDTLVRLSGDRLMLVQR